MKRLITRLLSLVLVLLLGMGGGVLLLFSERGNALLKPYLQTRLSQELSMPVKIRSFRLDNGRIRAHVLVDEKAQIGFIARYDLFKGIFRGSYRVVAHDFVYKGSLLRQADIKGRFGGTLDTLDAEGNGTVMDAPADFRLKIRHQKLVSLQANARNLSMSELLELLNQPPFAKGVVDVNIDMSHIGEKGAKGEGHVVLRKGHLNEWEIMKRYGCVIPQNTPFTLRADALLRGDVITFNAYSKSALWELRLDQGKMDTQSGAFFGAYDLNMTQMQILTQNRLYGALHLVGEIEQKGDQRSIRGHSSSLGGILRFSAGEGVTVLMEDISVEKVLVMLHQPRYLSGRLSGKIETADIGQIEEGSYRLVLAQGRPDAAIIRQRLGYKLPTDTMLEGDSAGTIEDGILRAEGNVRSDMATLRLSALRYDIGKRRFQTDFTLHSVKVARGVAIEGKAKYDKKVSLRGEAKGVGRKLVFGYDGTRARVEGEGIRIEKVLTLAALPRYVQGVVDANIVLDDTTRLNGSYRIKGDHLFTVPSVMQQLMGKRVKIGLDIDAKGGIKSGKAYGNAVIDTTVGRLDLEKMIVDLKEGTLSAFYKVHIPDLSKLYVLTGSRFYGTLVAKGKASKAEVLHVEGSTASLGGSVFYALSGESFKATIKAVPLERMLAFMGYTPHFLGRATGKAAYHLKRRRGTVNISLASFQLKPNEWTRILTPLLGKDPSRIIFKNTTLHADIKGDIVSYELHAKGTRSMIDVTQGRIDNRTRAQYAKFKIVYEKYTVYGTIKGTFDKPKITIDADRVLQQKLQKQLEKKLGDKAGALLKGLGF